MFSKSDEEMNYMNDGKFQRLKIELFNWGLDYIEEFLGFDAYGYSKDELNKLMDEVYMQIPEETLEEFYEKFLIN